MDLNRILRAYILRPPFPVDDPDAGQFSASDSSRRILGDYVDVVQSPSITSLSLNPTTVVSAFRTLVRRPASPAPLAMTAARHRSIPKSLSLTTEKRQTYNQRAKELFLAHQTAASKLMEVHQAEVEQSITQLSPEISLQLAEHNLLK